MKNSRLTILCTALGLLSFLSVNARADVYNDASSDLFDNGLSNLDITSVEVTNSATTITFKVTTRAFQNWTKYLIWIDTPGRTNAPANSNGWSRPANMAAGNGADYFVGSWVDQTTNNAQLWAWSGTNWTGPSTYTATITSNTVSYTFPLSPLGLSAGSVVKFDVATSGGGNDPGVDHLSNTNSTSGWGVASTGGPMLSYAVVASSDDDGDGLPNVWETQYGLNPNSATGADGSAGDPDNDTLTNAQEFARGTDPKKADTDSDGLNDGVETGTGTFVSSTNTGTDPLVADTDGDGMNDGPEVVANRNPLKRTWTVTVAGDYNNWTAAGSLTNTMTAADSDPNQFAKKLRIRASSANSNIKFTAGSWTTNWGASATAGTAALGGGNIKLGDGSGVYDVTFNTDTLAYTVTRVIFADYASFADPLGYGLGSAPGSADSDLDGVTNEAERLANTDPTNFDTDGDGIADNRDPAGLAGVIAVDGIRDGTYTNNTGVYSNLASANVMQTTSPFNFGNTNVLSNLYIRQVGNRLNLFIGGTPANDQATNTNSATQIKNHFLVFIDSKAGGVNAFASNTISTNNNVNASQVNGLAGMKLESGFNADYVVKVTGGTNNAWVNVHDLQAGTSSFAGESANQVVSTGILLQGRSQFPATATIGGSVTNGTELVLDLGAMGVNLNTNSPAQIKLMVLLANEASTTGYSQVLPSVPAGTVNTLATVDFDQISGSQTLTFQPKGLPQVRLAGAASIFALEAALFPADPGMTDAAGNPVSFLSDYDSKKDTLVSTGDSAAVSYRYIDPSTGQYVTASRLLVLGPPSLSDAKIQSPTNTPTLTSLNQADIYIQAFGQGITDLAGNPTNGFANFGAWVGYSTNNSFLNSSEWTEANGWTWQAATWNTQFTTYDEFKASLSGLAPADYYFVARFTHNGTDFIYGGLAGTWQDTFSTVQDFGRFTVTVPQITYATLQFPVSSTNTIIEGLTVYAQAYLAGLTDSPTNSVTNRLSVYYPNFRAEIGYGPSTNDLASWSWTNAPFNEGSLGNPNDEFSATLPAQTNTTSLTTNYYAARFTTDASNTPVTWIYAGLNGSTNPPQPALWVINPTVEVTAASIVSPVDAVVTNNTLGTHAVYAQFRVQGLTTRTNAEPTDLYPNFRAEIGYTTNTNAALSSWSWTNMTANTAYNTNAASPNDEYSHTWTNLTAGTNFYAVRFTLDSNNPTGWRYAGRNWTSTNAPDVTGLQLGQLVVEASNSITYATVQDPTNRITLSQVIPLTVYAQVFSRNVTEPAGSPTNIFPTFRAQIGYSSTSNAPTNSSWQWVNADWNTQAGNNDEFKAVLTNLPVGTNYYAARFTLADQSNATTVWRYAGWNGTSDPAQLGEVVINAAAITDATIQFPTNTVTNNVLGEHAVYAQLQIPDVTVGTNPVTFYFPRFRAEIGYTTNTNAALPTWSWTNMVANPSFNTNSANSNDEYSHTRTGLTPGTSYYAVRFALDSNNPVWRYAGRNWISTTNADVSVLELGQLVVSGIDYANVQFPPNATISTLGNMEVYAQVYAAGITEDTNAPTAPGFRAQIGVNSDTNALVNAGSWNWTNAVWNSQATNNPSTVNNDEYKATLSGLAPGRYVYVSRFSLDGGASWSYGGLNGPAPTIPATDYGQLTVEGIGWATIQHPKAVTSVKEGVNFDVYLQVYALAVTEANGAPSVPGFRAEWGFSSANTDPRNASGWTWASASYFSQQGNNDEYKAVFNNPIGTYYHVGRFSLDGGSTWTYAGVNGPWNSTNDSGVIEVRAADSSITLNPTGVITNFTYNGSSQGPAVTSSNFIISGSTASLEIRYLGRDGTSYGVTTNAPTNAGKYILRGFLPFDANYVQAETDLPFEIAPQPLTITGLTPTNKVYDGTNTVSVGGTAAFSGLVNGETFAPSNTVTWTFADKNAGSNKGLVASGTYTAPSGNYSLTQPALAATISPKPLTVTGVTASNKVYDGTNSVVVSGTPVLDSGVVPGDAVVLDSTLASWSFANANVGTGKVVTGSGFSLTGADKDNYSLAAPTVSADITARPITVTAEGKTKNQGAGDPALTYQVTSGSLVSGDSITGSLSRDAGEAAGNYPIRQNTLTAGSNYAITYVGANLTITAAGESISNFLQGQPTNAATVGKYLIGGATNINGASERPVMTTNSTNLVLSAIVRTNDANYSSNQVVGQWVTNVSLYTNLGANSNVVFGQRSANQAGVQTGFERRDFTVGRSNGTNRLFLRLKATLQP